MKNKLTVFVSILSFLFLVASPTFLLAQTSPASQPLVQQADMVYLGKITAPPTDGTGRGNSMDSLDYGAFGLGMGADGKSLYFGCHDWHDQIARISIPTIGQQASIITPCTPINNKSAINPGDPNGYNPGGMLVWNGKLITTMYPYYDASQSASGSHFSMSTDMTSQTGPFRLYPGPDGPTNRVGMVSGYMGLIPQEWRTLLGGPALSGQMGVPIIGRTSFGPTATVFDPDQLGQGSSVSKMLVGYPNEHQTLGGYSQSNPLFAGSDQVGGLAFPDGTRSVLFVGRHAATFCYGYGTSNQALHGTVDSAGVMFCYDPTSTNKGTHGYPYIHQVWAYDANDLLAVKNGTKQPWDIRPYATWKLTEMNNDGGAGAIVSATYDPTTKRFYMATGRTIHVYQVNIGTIAPPPVPDIIAPVVSVTAPSSGATVSSSVSISANATDNVGVVGVQFKIDGTNSGSEDFSSPYSINWDTTSFSNGNHAVTAIARDAAGNSATASSVTVNVANTTPPPPQTSPTGHWMFDSNLGTTALDSSGNSNNGNLINGPFWTTGKIGNALSFDGVDDYVNLGTPSSLALGSKITLAGWVNLSDNSVARMIISKDDGQNTPTFIRTQGSAARCLIGGTQVGDLGSISTNTWNHIACTYDGSNVVLYVNGTQVGSVPKNGNIVDNLGNWNVGSRVNGSAMLMKGMLDDVRVYNRALSSSEISTLASNAGVTDTTKPTVKLTAPTSSFTTVAGIPVLASADATDNVGVVGVQFKLDGVNLGAEDTTAPYSTIWDTTNATEGAHVLTAVARDAAGNTQTGTPVTVSVTKSNPVDTVKPSVSITDPINNEEVSGSVNILATASDDTGVVGVQFKLNGTNLNSEDNTAPYTTAWNSETVSNGSYSLTAVARDAAGNTQTSSVVLVNVSNISEDVLVVPPDVELLEPNSGASVSGVVTVSASAEDDKGVAGVQFKLDGVNMLPEDTTVPYSISWDTKTSPNGSRALTATARDLEGNQVTSLVRMVNVINATPTSSLKIGDRIKTTAWVNVRSTAGGRYVGSQRTGRTGTITAGPVEAKELVWWKVNFTSGADGWVAEKYITKAMVAMTEEDYRQNIANIYLIIKYLQERIAGQN